MEENIQAQSPDAEVSTAQPTVEQSAADQEIQFTDDDLAFAQWSLMLGAYMQNLLADPASAASEFEAVARSLREQFQQAEEPAPEPKPEPTPAPAPQPPQGQNPADINALVAQAVEQAMSKMMEQLRKQALASPAGLQGRAVSSKRLADLLE